MVKPGLFVALLGAASLAACVATVPSDPNPARQFRLPTGEALYVTREGQSAVLIYPATYPLTDAETASYVMDATGCRPGALTNTGINPTSAARTAIYSLICS